MEIGISGELFGMEPTTPDVMYEPPLSNGNAALKLLFRGGGDGGEGSAANYEVRSVV